MNLKTTFYKKKNKLLYLSLSDATCEILDHPFEQTRQIDKQNTLLLLLLFARFYFIYQTYESSHFPAAAAWDKHQTINLLSQKKKWKMKKKDFRSNSSSSFIG